MTAQTAPGQTNDHLPVIECNAMHMRSNHTGRQLSVVWGR